ncbi:MAG: gfo/Idh/MocA family oxidoreductase [Planctomycetota bacterium]|nr:MAG: gfo/Idh/MocA family oxidoreductase [Planctomycetota bacterium]
MPLDRRAFLRWSAAAGVAAAWTGLAAARPGRPPWSPNDQIGIGLIGVGGMGGAHLRTLLGMPEEFRVLAVADVDRGRAERAAAAAGGVPSFGDYRRLLELPELDAVLIATPDHWHALPAVHACEAGLDVYCEKPLSLTIRQGREMVRAARRAGRVFQTGSQQRSDPLFRRAVELVRNGAIGRIERVQVALFRGPSAPWQPPEPPPDGLDWDFWLGPLPWEEYRPRRCHYDFRWFLASSGGMLTDWGAHHNDIAQWGLGREESGPVEIEGTAEFDPDSMFTTPVRFEVHYRYPDGVELVCSSEGRNGVTFHGEGGRIFVTRGALEADPPELLDLPVGGSWRLPPSPGHHRDFAACVRSRSRPIADVEIGHRSATICHLGNLAILLRRRLFWDPEQERFRRDEEANRLLDRPMRAPWSL